MKYYLWIGVAGCLTPSPHVTKLPSPKIFDSKTFGLPQLMNPIRFGLVN